RLSPQTQTHINEAGCIAANDLQQGAARTGKAPSAAYWNLCGAVFAYLYAGLAEQGIDVLGASQLVGYPTQFPSVTLLQWPSGAPNARYRVLQLLHESFGPGDRMVKAALQSPDVYAAAYLSAQGERRILLINKRAAPVELVVSNAKGAREQHVDVDSADSQPEAQILTSDTVHLGGFSVMVIRLTQANISR
ncbi:MAG TPA: hypothetical protein VGB94_08925, partial [Acidobacteriaceae bacterium]